MYDKGECPECNRKIQAALVAKCVYCGAALKADQAPTEEEQELVLAKRKKAEDDRGDGTFYWLGKGTPLSTLETEERKIEIIENHELRVKRLEKKLNRRANLLRAKVKISDTDRMDEIYDEVEGGGACVTCYK